MVHPPLRVDAQGDRLRLLHVHAHPDDESSKGAATTARYVAEGVDVMVATCTGGERGSILNKAMDRPDVLANLAEVRRQEMDRAREILGIRQVWLGFVDSGLPEGDPLPPLPTGCFATLTLDEAVRPLVQVIRAFRPARAHHVRRDRRLPASRSHHVPPDHGGGLRRRRGPRRLSGRSGEPWQALKLYYSFAFHRARMVALDQAMAARGLESPYAERLADWPDDPVHAARVTTRVDCADYFHLRDQALLAHATQIDPGGSVVLRARWRCTRRRGRPRTGNSRAAWCRPSTPEDDLFAGIAPPATSRVSA